MKPTLYSTLSLLLIVQLGMAQNIRVKIIDATTGDNIPYANIRMNESENLVSNGEGYFSLSESNSTDETLLTISYLGYVNQQLTVSALKNSISRSSFCQLFTSWRMLRCRIKNPIHMKSWPM